MKRLKLLLLILFSMTTITLQAATREVESIPLGLWVAICMFIIFLLLAFYSKRNETKDNPTNTTDDIEVNQKSPKRIQHYKFAHEILKNMFLENPEQFVKNTLHSEDDLRGLWYNVGKFYSEQYEEVEELDGSDIKIIAKEFEDNLLVIISMPEPKDIPEAYFIGLIIPHDDTKNARYITLEHGEEGSVLCEWTNEAHLNFGEGPEPTLDNFKDKLVEMSGVSVDTWNASKPIYKGEKWMQNLWDWADTYDISPLTLPRNSKDLQALESLSLEFEEKKPEYLPKEIGNLSNLHTFIMHYSSIKELPDEFSNLVNLKYLYLDGNELTKLPETFCSLVELEKVSLSYNNLTLLPDCIGKLQNMVSLNLNLNLLKELPESMSELKLEELRLRDNPVEYISKEVQHFLNITRKSDTLTKEPFTVVWQECGEDSEYARRFGVADFDGYLPFFLSGEEVSKIESDDGVMLTERHLLLGILYGLNIAGKGSIRLREQDEEVLISLVDTLSEGYGFETIEEMIIDASTRIRNINGTHPSQLMLETGNKLVPESDQIKEHLILDLWCEISYNEDNIELLEEIPILLKEINLAAMHSYTKQLICYYGLCALIFTHLAKNEDYLENDLVDEYLKRYFYPNVTDKLLLNNATAFMENPDNFQPIDLWSPMM